MNIMRKAGTFALASMCTLTPVASVPVFAATSATDSNNTAVSKDLKDSDIIDYSKTGSLTIHKYDITSAEAAKDYVQGTRVANGEKDTILEEKMKDYAIEGVQFTYLRVGNIETYSDTKNGNTDVEVVYEIPTALAKILGLNTQVGNGAKDAKNMNGNGVAKKCTKAGVFHYTSTQISDALKAILDADEVAARSALENYLVDYSTQGSTTDGGLREDNSTNVTAVNMPKTDKNGFTKVDGLELGLYLVVETEVPEQVTETVNPWFVSLPFTNITNEEGTKTGGDYWLYDMDCYPKNQTGNPTLDKSVRNAYSSTSTTDKNGTVNKGNNYDYSEATGQGGLIVFNDDTNAANKADKDENKYVANRGGYTKDGVTAGKDGAGYSTDYEYRDTQTASAGDVLDYILVSKLPHISSKASFLSEYTFTDILSKGITYNKDVKIAFYSNAADANANNTANAVALWNVTSGNQTQDYVDISVTDGMAGHQWKDGSTQMTVKLTEKGLNIINGEGINGNNQAQTGDKFNTSKNSMSDMYMVVYYTATVNSDATLTLGDDGNENDVVLTWSRTSNGYYNTLEDRNYVYAYGVDLTKSFSDKKGDMSKVQFKLYNSTDSYYVVANKAEDGNWYVTGKTMKKEDGTTFTPDDKGKIFVYGLEADTYGLTEISTDNGYTLLEDSINVAITPTDREINASVAGTTGMDRAAIDSIVQYYHGGIYDENGDYVTVSKDYIKDTNGSRPAIKDANGRTIGKTDMFVGAIKPATAKVDNVNAEMTKQTYTKGDMPSKFESSDATVVMHVVNNKNFTLPRTGGYGTIIFTLAGCAVALGGVAVVTKKSKKHTPTK